MIRWMLTAAAVAASGLALAKLPPLDEAAKAKAAEAAAKAAWQGKVDQYLLCKSQDKVAAYYRKTGGAKAANALASTTGPSISATAVTPAGATPPAGAATAAATPATAAAAASAAAPATAAATPPAASASQGGTPVATVATPSISLATCTDPGPFAYAPPEQKPLETSGAHSPAATATSPPSVRAESATMTPAKPGTATKP
ncbi:MAG: hypothetical protein JWP41_1746 [Ramlibacter sp.]|jgi:hypothetical protein|nr:hypothetical protein [Ramlibacter sp.]